MEESEQQSIIIWGADNTFKSYLVEKGDVDAVWKEAAHIIEGEYFTGAQEQLYIENNGVIAAFDPEMESPSGARCSVRTTFIRR